MALLTRIALICAICLVVGYAVMLGAAETPAPPAAAPREGLVYPQGTRFPLGLYSLLTRNAEEMRTVESCGWNLAQTYVNQDGLLANLADSRIAMFFHVADAEEAAARQTIERYAATGRVAWWDLPEEQRYWRPGEFALVKNISVWTRRYDPEQRPNFMYLPGHYTAEQIARYVPYLDIIGAGAYTEYQHMPRAWVRYRIETEIEAIRLAGHRIGADYLHGERIPIGIPMLFAQTYAKDNTNTFPDITPAGAYHDFYACLAAGARGILVFSYFHRNDPPGLRQVYDVYAKAAREVSGPIGLGQALLFGDDVQVGMRITAGAQRTGSFRPTGEKADISYPAVNLRAVRRDGNLFIVAVNSAEKPDGPTVLFDGLPAGVREVRVPFEDRTIPVKNGAFTDAFQPLGVHIYQVTL